MKENKNRAGTNKQSKDTVNWGGDGISKYDKKKSNRMIWDRQYEDE